MRTGMCLKLAVSVIVVASATAVLAQGNGQRRGPGGPGFGRGGFGNDPSVLLSAESVQKELGLTEDQKTQTTKFADDNQQATMAMMQELRSSNATPEERQAKMAERTKENKKKLADILLPPQVDRLNEVFIQYSGAGALAQPEIAEKLKITEDQKQKLQDLAMEVGQKMRDVYAGGFPMTDEERADVAKKTQKIQADQKDQAVAMLTSEQKAQFEKMQGKKFDIATIQLPFNFGRRGGPGGPGAPGGNRGAGAPGT